MLKNVFIAGAVALLSGCVVAPGYDYGYGYGYQQPYSTGYYGYESGYAPAYGAVNIGIWGGGRGYGHRGDWPAGGHGGPRGPGGHGPAAPGGPGGGGGHGGGHGGGSR
jgi:hypothetical protein